MPILVYKKNGQTPLESIEELRQQEPAFASEKLSYAGRLDPMAEGLLLILVGDENFERKKYERLNKEYEFTVLFGISTDTYDILGEICKVDFSRDVESNDIRKVLKHLSGERDQEYPPYSSAKVSGKPLYYWARRGKLDKIQIPKKKITIYELEMISSERKPLDKLVNRFVSRVKVVSGDFRQEKTVKLWEELHKKRAGQEVVVASFKISCSSGTYIRQLVHELGQYLSIPCVMTGLRRIAVGPYALEPLSPGKFLNTHNLSGTKDKE